MMMDDVPEEEPQKNRVPSSPLVCSHLGVLPRLSVVTHVVAASTKAEPTTQAETEAS